MKKIVGLLFAAALVVGLATRGNAQNTEMKQVGYVEYSEKAFNDASKLKRVYFFAASWCPSCRAADKAFKDKTKQIPENVVIFKTDYDSENALKSKYGITRQHTFVYVDAKGAALKKWSGGDISELIANTK